MTESETTTAAEAERLDDTDPLREFRSRFLMPQTRAGEPSVYFTGNSLGLQPKTTREYIEAELDDWARLGVEGHLHAKHPWLPYHEFLTEKMARVVGAKLVETVVMNSLTVNLHLMLISFYRPTGTRRKIMMEKGSFPSDRYAVVSQIRLHGGDPDRDLVELAPRDGESCLRTEDILEAIEAEGEELALVLFGGVNYYTGQAFDMAAISAAAHAAGAYAGFDLAHAAGNLELHLHDQNVDFAVWCSYKYLNAGPGGIAGAFVHERHASDDRLLRLAGWWGHDKDTRFLMSPDFVPIKGAEGWQISNPPIFQLAALRASLDIFDEAGMPALREKSIRLTNFLESRIRSIASERIEIITPSDPIDRGCQLSIRVKDADRSLFDSITARGVVADWREPDVIRVAPVPLYNSFADVQRFAEVLSECISF